MVDEAFAEFDTSGDGRLSRAEFLHGLSQLRLGLSSKESAQLFHIMDLDGNGFLSVSEFVGAIQRGIDTNSHPAD